MKEEKRSMRNGEVKITPPHLHNLTNEEFVKPYAEATGLTEDEARKVLEESEKEVERVERLMNDEELKELWKEE